MFYCSGFEKKLLNCQRSFANYLLYCRNYEIAGVKCIGKLLQGNMSIVHYQVYVLMEVLGFVIGLVLDVLKCASMELGPQCVTKNGMTMMQLSSAIK